MTIAKFYREKLNPIDNILSEKDALLLKENILKKVRAELRIRIEKGYLGIRLDLVELEVEKALKSLLVL